MVVTLLRRPTQRDHREPLASVRTAANAFHYDFC